MSRRKFFMQIAALIAAPMLPQSKPTTEIYAYGNYQFKAWCEYEIAGVQRIYLNGCLIWPTDFVPRDMVLYVHRGERIPA